MTLSVDFDDQLFKIWIRCNIRVNFADYEPEKPASTAVESVYNCVKNYIIGNLTGVTFLGFEKDNESILLRLQRPNACRVSLSLLYFCLKTFLGV